MPAITDWGKSKFRSKRLDGTKPYDITGYEAASQTFGMGDFLIQSSGSMAIAAAAGASVAASATIVGVATEAASGTTADPCKVEASDGNVAYLLPAYHATPSSATTAITQIGKTYDLYNHATLGWCVSLASTTAPYARVISIDTANAVGATYGGLWVQIPAASRLIS